MTLGSSREKAHGADPEEHRNESAEEGDEADEGAAIVDIQRERGRKQGCAHDHSDQKDLERRPELRRASVGGWSMIISRVPAKASAAPSSASQPP